MNLIARKYGLAAAAALGIGVVSGSASAAFFQLQENSASGVGNANAGGAAAAEDASTVWYNPAGLTRLSGSQVVVAGHLIMPSTKFDKTSATVNSLPTMTTPGEDITGGEGGDAGESAVVPNFYYSHSINERTVFGLGITVPFGLATEYDDDWVGRYHAIRSEVKTLNINPAVGYRVNDQLSVGAGLNAQRIEATLTQAIDIGTICDVSNCAAGLTQQSADGKADVTAKDDLSFGFNLGFLYQPVPDTRVGFHYRSSIQHELEGKENVSAPNPLADAVLASPSVNIVDADAKADVELPATLSLSFMRQLNQQWTFMADVTRTYWSNLPKLQIEFDSAQADSVVTLDLKDVNRYSAGATYAPGGPWSYRFGVALDETPVPNAEARTPRLPDADRLWLAFGANYRASKDTSIDIAFVHIMIDDAKIDKSTGTNPAGENFFRGNLEGTFEDSVNILSLQGSWSF